MSYKQENYIGKTFGRLKILSFGVPKIYGKAKNKIATVICICSCGNEVISVLADIKIGKIKSCGCLSIGKTNSNFKHGASLNKKLTTEYSSWINMKDRCYNLKNSHYIGYGGRGIKVCEEWKNNFSKFLQDMGKKPSNKHSIDRINNDLGYFKENCRWATVKEQANNTRTNNYITFLDKIQTLKQWCDELNLNYNTIRSRLRYGWSIEKTFNTL